MVELGSFAVRSGCRIAILQNKPTGGPMCILAEQSHRVPDVKTK